MIRNFALIITFLNSFLIGNGFSSETKCDEEQIHNCSDFELCVYATFESNGFSKWRRGYATNFINEAQSRNLSCGTTADELKSNNKTCRSDPVLCNDSDLCFLSTSIAEHDKSISWNFCSNSNLNHIKEAKERNLTCGATRELCGISDADNCKDNPSICSDYSICKLTTIRTTDMASWDIYNADGNLLDEAERRGLDCDVGFPIKNRIPQECYHEPSLCNVEELCERSTISIDGELRWVSNTALEHVAEALKRGLTCEVQQECIVSDPKRCSDKQLCKLATEEDGGKISWGSFLKSYEVFIKEAKDRGLSCKVGETVCSPEYNSKCSDEHICSRATTKTDYGPIWLNNAEWDDVAQQRGLSCGVNASAYENFGFRTKLPPCPKDGSKNNCFGSNKNTDGDLYIGEWVGGYEEGFGVFYSNKKGKHKGDRYFGEFKNGKRHGWGLYTWPAGYALYQKWEASKQGSYRSNSNVHAVLPALKQSFNALDLDQRKVIQYALTEMGYYNSSIDGKWGRNTLNALAEFAVLRMRTINLNRRDIAQNVIIEVAKVALGEEEEEEQNNNSANIYQNDNTIVNAASGTGFFISEKGHIMTNNHVIEGCSRVKTFIDGTEIEAKKIATDRTNDLALLKVDQSPAHVFPLSSNNPEILQDVYVAGFPFGEAVSSSIKVTRGIVSAVTGLGNNYSEIQIDAAIQPGNSGGPIVDEFGNILGVAVAKLDLEKIIEDYGVIPENVNFGVKVSAVKNLLEGNGITALPSSAEEISKTSLGKNLTKGTVHLSCYMTIAQIKKLQNKKAFFKQFEN